MAFAGALAVSPDGDHISFAGTGAHGLTRIVPCSNPSTCGRSPMRKRMLGGSWNAASTIVIGRNSGPITPVEQIEPPLRTAG
jgi:hypothetical protein